MADTGQSPIVDLETLVGLSLVRIGSDTKAPRLLREVVWPAWLASGEGSGTLLDRLADALSLFGGERIERLGRARRGARQALLDAQSGRLTVLSMLDPAYPPWLGQIPDPPIVLWMSGDASVLNPPIAVALVGSRDATPGGLAIAGRLSRELAESGVAVVSGLARGIDAAAHRGALDGRGRTIAVLGNGADVVYPPQHRELAREIATIGALVTEFPPGSPPYASHFPLRNRIISGLCRAVVVVEASEKSGSLITARAALEQGRDVLAVPGNVASGCYRGCHALIKDGARLVETVGDILEEIGWIARGQPASQEDNCLGTNGLEARMAVGEPVTIDQLAIRTRRSASEVLAQLGELEVAGKVARMPGGTFVRLDGPATNRER